MVVVSSWRPPRSETVRISSSGVNCKNISHPSCLTIERLIASTGGSGMAGANETWPCIASRPGKNARGHPKIISSPSSPLFPVFRVSYGGGINVITPFTARPDPLALPISWNRREIHTVHFGDPSRRQTIRYCFGFDDWKERGSRWPFA